MRRWREGTGCEVEEGEVVEDEGEERKREGEGVDE
jgi:hypothetical protein